MRNRFILAVIFPLVIDHIVTVIGQPDIYWTNYYFANEGSPFKFLLQHNPISFLLWGTVYAIAMIFILKKLPAKLSLFCGLIIYTGHVWGSSSWISKLLSMINSNIDYWYATIGYFIITSLILSWGLLYWHKKESKKSL